MKKKCVLIILDGFGHRIVKKDNGPAMADMPFYDSLLENYPHTYIQASNHYVGLPDGQMGTSEVGHMNIGSGRVIKQELVIIDEEVKNKKFFKNEALNTVINHVKDKKSSLHIMGLMSDGGVHSSLDHVYAILDYCKKKKVKKVFIHAFTDGRDTQPASANKYINKLKKYINGNDNINISTISGRYYAMDRDNRWDRVQKAYNTMTGIKFDEYFKTTNKLIKSSYENGKEDEFIVPAVVDCNDEDQFIGNNDGVLFVNFRPDRARQITRAFVDKEFDPFDRKKIKNLKFGCMTRYDDTIKGVKVLYESEKIKNTLAETLAKKKLKQFHTAETEKYAHVTYFFNCGVELPHSGEDWLLVPSPKVATYDLKPEMSAKKVTKGFMDALKSNKYDFLVVNFANPDMVGHTGKKNAILKALETVDGCLKQIITHLEKNNISAILTADHGNCDQMAYANGTPHTAHTTNKVPFILIDSKDHDLEKEGALCNIAPTVLELMGIKKPKEMTSESMISKE